MKTEIKVVCKKCNLTIKLGNNTLKDFKGDKFSMMDLEFIHVTGYCGLCLVELGYCD